MALADRILALVESTPGITDAELAELLPAGVSRHQQVNQRCRSLATQGLIVREKRGARFIGNYPAPGPSSPSSGNEDSARPRVGEKRPPVGAAGRCPAVPPGGTVSIAFETSRVSVSFAWHSAGEVTLDHETALVFPELKAVPGLYRFRFPHNRTVYVGETVNLRRRMQNYRTPGARQRTSIRVNGLIRSTLREGHVILLETSADVRLAISDKGEPANLSSKTARVFAEHAALLVEEGKGWTTLNRAN